MFSAKLLKVKHAISNITQVCFLFFVALNLVHIRQIHTQISMEVDYIVVGQGLMGSLLSAALQRRAQRVYVFDESAKWAASPHAAGLYNPLSGRGMQPSWQAKPLFGDLLSHYQALEAQWRAHFVHPMPMYRPFLSLAEAKQWRPRPEALPYIDTSVAASAADGWCCAPFGGIWLRKVGQVNVRALLSAARRELGRRGLFSEAAFVADRCHLLAKGGLDYEGLQAKAVIFCEGIGVQQNPFFAGLPLRPLAGEWLEGELAHPLPYIINRQGYTVPLPGSRRLRIGCTYVHVKDGRQLLPSPIARRQLISTYHRLCRVPLRLKRQGIAARPSTSDRRPWVGLHPKHPAIGICNGLGTKGVSLAPFVAESMCDLLLEKKSVHSEMQLLRKQGLQL